MKAETGKGDYHYIMLALYRRRSEDRQESVTLVKV